MQLFTNIDLKSYCSHDRKPLPHTVARLSNDMITMWKAALRKSPDKTISAVVVRIEHISVSVHNGDYLNIELCFRSRQNLFSIKHRWILNINIGFILISVKITSVSDAPPKNFDGTVIVEDQIIKFICEQNEELRDNPFAVDFLL